MRLVDLPLHPSVSTLRQFAMLWFICFSALAGWQAMPHGPKSGTFILGGVALVGVVGWMWPALLKPIFVGWLILVFPIAWVVSHTVLALLFFGLFTPLACIFRLVSRDVLARAKPAGATYWTVKPAATDLRQYLRQF